VRDWWRVWRGACVSGNECRVLGLFAGKMDGWTGRLIAAGTCYLRILIPAGEELATWLFPNARVWVP
jgi:hypothetical protein